jgi:dipeptidase
MCDTILAAPSSTAERLMLFGKNSDRYRNEAQAVELAPGREHAAGTEVRCTYISIPQQPCTHTVLICRPFWMWGAEMGVNEHGVAIGNEGVQARSPAPVNEALTGMDLLRLTLERAGTAAEAVDVLTTLLERHGQGGNCGHLKRAHYNNSFIIADASDAYVLETVDREWLLERVTGVRALSNIYSIMREPLRTSAGLLEWLRQTCGGAAHPVDYAQAIGNPDSQHIGQSTARWKRSTTLLSAAAGRLETSDMMRILRDHGSDEPAAWEPRSDSRRTLCMHAGAENVAAQTTGSLVSELCSAGSVHWVTGTAAPCISIFKPVLLDVPLPNQGPTLSDRFDSATLWWRHEYLHRSALRGQFATFLDAIRHERDELEADFRLRVSAVLGSDDQAVRRQVIEDCWRRALDAERAWHRHLSRGKIADDPYHSAWQAMSRIAGVPGPDPATL